MSKYAVAICVAALITLSGCSSDSLLGSGPSETIQIGNDDSHNVGGGDDSHNVGGGDDSHNVGGGDDSHNVGGGDDSHN